MRACRIRLPATWVAGTVRTTSLLLRGIVPGAAAMLPSARCCTFRKLRRSTANLFWTGIHSLSAFVLRTNLYHTPKNAATVGTRLGAAVALANTVLRRRLTLLLPGAMVESAF